MHRGRSINEFGVDVEERRFLRNCRQHDRSALSECKCFGLVSGPNDLTCVLFCDRSRLPKDIAECGELTLIPFKFEHDRGIWRKTVNFVHRWREVSLGAPCT